MSWRTWDVNGYGISDEDIRLVYDTKDIMHLLKNAPITRDIIETWLRNQSDPNDDCIFDEYEDEQGRSGGLAIITKAVSEIEDITLEYHCAENGNFILFPPYYPWQDHTKNDNNMTTDKLDLIYTKYFGSNGDYVSAQYCG